jgi:hypothetical protein
MHPAKVDDYATVAERLSGDAVPATPYGDLPL